MSPPKMKPPGIAAQAADEKHLNDESTIRHAQSPCQDFTCPSCGKDIPIGEAAFTGIWSPAGISARVVFCLCRECSPPDQDALKRIQKCILATGVFAYVSPDAGH